MANGLGELELELELEGLAEGEGEGEFETEFESEHEGESELEFEGEGELEFELEGEGEFESELEGEFEGEFEGESLLNPVTRVYPDAMMEHMGLAAMESETEFEAAEHFLPLIPLVASKLLPIAARALPRIAGRVLPRVARALTRATPRLTRSIGHLVRTLHRQPHRRHLVRVIPSVARRAMTTIAKRAAAGHPVSPRQAVRILARENRRVLGNPQIVRSVLRRSRAMDRRYHRLGSRYGIVPGATGRSAGYPYTYRTGSMPARGWHAHPHYAWPTGGRTRVCPTCGTPATRGVRRMCCCC